MRDRRRALDEHVEGDGLSLVYQRDPVVPVFREGRRADPHTLAVDDVGKAHICIIADPEPFERNGVAEEIRGLLRHIDDLEPCALLRLFLALFGYRDVYRRGIRDRGVHSVSRLDLDAEHVVIVAGLVLGQGDTVFCRRVEDRFDLRCEDEPSVPDRIKQRADAYVIYADTCTISKDDLKKWNIIFKKIPRDIAKL